MHDGLQIRTKFYSDLIDFSVSIYLKLSMRSEVLLLFILYSIAIVTVDCNSEGDALYAFKVQLSDPYNVLMSWDPTLVNPCTWLHITCNSENSVTRVDLGNAGLSGPLVPQLGMLANLQYLQLGRNDLSGSIPPQIGNLTSLISLGLEHNKLTGFIPATLGHLRSLIFLRVNSNQLRGNIPLQVIQLIFQGNLREMNVSDNHLAGTARGRGGSKIVTTTVIQDARA